MKTIKNLKIIIVFIQLIILNSCGTFTFTKTSDFKKNVILDSLEGNYFAHSKISKTNNYDVTFFNLINKTNVISDYFTLKFISSNELKVKFIELKKDSLIENEIVLKGKRKKHFFEVYLSKKQFFIPFLFGQIDVDRLRIGFDKNNHLLVRNLYDNTGYLLFLGGSTSGDRRLIFENVSQSNIIRPFEIQNKWGYIYKNDTVIKPVFEYSKAMIDHIGIVKKLGKWALINDKGSFLTEFDYDSIQPIQKTLKDNILQYYYVYQNSKVGIVNSKGKITVPIVYNSIFFDGQFYKLKLNDKIGFCNLNEVVIPAIYTNVSYFIYETYKMAQAERNNKIYFIDMNGYEYVSKQNPLYYKIGKIENGNALIPDYSTKRKLIIDEQFE